MTDSSYLDPLLFAVLPYVVFFTFFLVTIQRYRARTFTYSSLSSQFLENQRHFWGYRASNQCFHLRYHLA